MSSSATTVRQRGGQGSKKAGSVPQPTRDDQLSDIVKPEKLKAAVGSEWDYKLALAVITTLAFITRFWGIGHPNEVVFDEVHFGKVRGCERPSRTKSTSRAAARGVWQTTTMC